jgi:hypothetical protein
MIKWFFFYMIMFLAGLIFWPLWAILIIVAALQIVGVGRKSTTKDENGA